jgi:hypothetical protein
MIWIKDTISDLVIEVANEWVDKTYRSIRNTYPGPNENGNRLENKVLSTEPVVELK